MFSKFYIALHSGDKVTEKQCDENISNQCLTNMPDLEITTIKWKIWDVLEDSKSLGRPHKI